MNVENNLSSRNIQLPIPPKPVAAYVPCKLVGNLVYVSGQGPAINGCLTKAGKVGIDLTAEQGYQAARDCGLNIIAQLQQFLGDLDRVRSVVQIVGYVACDQSFAGQPQVVNGASDLMVEVFGESGKHTRYALGSNALPGNIPVEVGAIVEIISGG
jgi:enamine deaminase RidA (YjgF/YER057c/UK114 family)